MAGLLLIGSIIGVFIWQASIHTEHISYGAGAPLGIGIAVFFGIGWLLVRIFVGEK